MPLSNKVVGSCHPQKKAPFAIKAGNVAVTMKNELRCDVIYVNSPVTFSGKKSRLKLAFLKLFTTTFYNIPLFTLLSLGVVWIAICSQSCSCQYLPFVYLHVAYA